MGGGERSGDRVGRGKGVRMRREDMDKGMEEGAREYGN